MDKSNKELNVKMFRPWGYYQVIAEGSGYASKILHVDPGQKLSVQSHNYRSEHWVVACGSAKVLLNDKEFVLNAGQSIDIPVKAIHSLENSTDDILEIVELQLGEIISEDDITRYSDIYGRA